MKKLKNYINNTVLVKVASLNSVSVLIKIITGLITSKFIAIFLGPEGLALLGNLRDFVGSVKTFSILGLYNGTIKYVAEFKKNKQELSKVLSTVYFLGLITTVITGVVCFSFSGQINGYIFNEINYEYVIKIFAIVLPFYALNMFFLAIMNGFSKFKTLIVFNIIGQIIGAAITILLIWKQQVEGALIAIVIIESVLLLITLIGVCKKKKIAPLVKRSAFSTSLLKKLGSYSFMALFSAIVLPFVAIYIRNYLTNELGIREAGMWEAMNRISKYYLMFISSLMALYILPRFSEIDSKKAFRAEVFNFYKTIIPIFGLILIVIYCLRHFIIQLILTQEFQPVEDLFLWQLLGDFVKVLSIVITYQFLAKRMFWHYILIEAFSAFALYMTSIYFIDIYGLKGANIAYFITFMLHYTIVLIVFSKSLFGTLPQENI